MKKKKNLIVLCGPMGCGKTTLINNFLQKNRNYIHVDVFNHFKKYKDRVGHIEEKNTIRGYSEMYKSLYSQKGKNVILELGTNHAEFNLKNLLKLRNKYEITLFLCLLDKKTCIERTLKRAELDIKRPIPKKDLLKKFKRAFPENHIKLAVKFAIPYETLEMGAPIDQRLGQISI